MKLLMLLQKINKVFIYTAILFLFIKCATPNKSLYYKCKDEVLKSFFFEKLVDYLGQHFDEMTFYYHRLNEKSVLNADVKEPNIKKNEIYNLVNEIANSTKLEITKIQVYDSYNMEFSGHEQCSFSIIMSNDILNFIIDNDKYKKYVYVEKYSDETLEHDQCIIKINEKFYLSINQLRR